MLGFVLSGARGPRGSEKLLDVGDKPVREVAEPALKVAPDGRTALVVQDFPQSPGFDGSVLEFIPQMPHGLNQVCGRPAGPNEKARRNGFELDRLVAERDVLNVAGSQHPEFFRLIGDELEPMCGPVFVDEDFDAIAARDGRKHCDDVGEDDLVPFEPREVVEAPADPSDLLFGVEPVHGDVDRCPGADVDEISRGPDMISAAAAHPLQDSEANAVRSGAYHGPFP